jgi:exodeoxyribonuclease V gamma subunit
MAFHLTVAGSLEPLADALAGVLADQSPGADPFESELVVVPGEGVKAWLRARLSRRLGATGTGTDGPGNGVVANIDHVFPATVVHAALGDDLDLGVWTTGPLTWSVHEVLQSRGAEFGQRTDALRARAIADLFDRYTLHRHRMVVQWSEGRDVDATGAPLEAHQLWQPALWRAVQAHLSPDPAHLLPTDAQRMVARTDELRAGAHVVGDHPHLRRRVMLFGLASLPSAHLEVLAALSTQLDVHVYAPTASAHRWRHVREQLTSRLALPIGRGDPRMPTGVGHPLITTWGRSSRESHALLLDAASHVPAVIEAPEHVAPLVEPVTLLARLQHDIRTDQAPLAIEDRPLLAPDDPSLRLHRAHGPARQVEILRDHLLHLFTETDATGSPRYMPRDVAVLCSDIATFAPLIEATFAGDPDGGVPRIPVRVADRTVRQQSALLDTAGALLGLLDGRFRASQVLDLAARPPVRLRFGLDAAALSRIEDWAAATNVRWGLDGTDHAAFGLPDDLSAHTWQSGLDQLLVGSTMTAAGPRLSSVGVAPFADLEGGDVELAGAFAELLHQLRRVTDALRTDATVHDWSERLLEGLHALCDTTADESWQWRDVEFAIGGFRDEAKVGDGWRRTIVPAAELIELMRIRLDASGGRARFGTGSVTVSSLTAQRGVPHPVVCLLGIDDDLGAGAMAAAEDLIASAPCIGDRDARSEHRAQLLDAVLSAGERLVLLSTGRDVRTNQALSPAVAVAELLEAIDATVQTDDGRRASVVLTIDHPRQAWSDVAFIPGELGVPSAWSFDRGALDAARARRSNEQRPPFLSGPLPAPPSSSIDMPLVSLDQLRSAVRNPARVLLHDRLGMTILDPDELGDDQIPLTLGGLQEWAITDALLRSRLDHGLDTDPARIAEADQHWEAHERARGSVPPGRFGDDTIGRVRARVMSLLSVLRTELGSQPHEPSTVAVRLDLRASAGVVLEGNVQGVCGDVVVAISPSGLKPVAILTSLIDLCALALHDPDRVRQAVAIGRIGTSGDPTAGAYRLSLRDPSQAADVLGVFLDLRQRALCDAIPAFATTSKHVHAGDMGSARTAWSPNHASGSTGDRGDRWVSAIPELDIDFTALAALPARADEVGPDGSFVTRLDYWADRLWGTVERFADVVEPGGGADGPDSSTDGVADPGEAADD